MILLLEKSLWLDMRTHKLCASRTRYKRTEERQTGGLHIPAFMAALDAYNKHKSDAKNGNRQVQDFIAFAASIDAKNFWDGVYHDQWVTNR